MAPSPHRSSLARRLTSRVGALLTIGAVVALPLLAAGPAEAAPVSSTGWLRAAHLSPDTGAVDVWLTPFGGVAKAAAVPGVTYGSVTAYRSLAPGYYTLAMRPAGSPASTPAMLSDTVQVKAGQAYSVLAVGAAKSLSFHVVADDLTAPTATKSRVRLIQASTISSAVDVSAIAGPSLVQDAAYGLVSSYTEVPQGRWNLQIAPAGGGAATTAQIDLPAGSVTTLLVLNGPSTTGGVMLKPVTDAAAAAVVPKGGVNTGEGGLATATEPSSNVLVPLALGLAVAGTVLWRRNRPVALAASR
jgi:hypothetical protein